MRGAQRGWKPRAAFGPAEFVRRDRDLNYTSATCRAGEDINDAVKEGTVITVTPALMRTGLERLAAADFPAAKRHFTDAISENGDAITADVVLQHAMLGELVFG